MGLQAGWLKGGGARVFVVAHSGRKKKAPPCIPRLDQSLWAV